MGYTLVYTQVLEFFPYLIRGALISLQIAILAFFGGMFFGLIFATIRTFGNKLMNNLVIWYVTFFTNTPQLVQIYFLFFALARVWYFVISFCSCVSWNDTKCCSIFM